MCCWRGARPRLCAGVSDARHSSGLGSTGGQQGLQGCGLVSGRAPGRAFLPAAHPHGWLSHAVQVSGPLPGGFCPHRRAGGFRNNVSEELFLDKG